MSLTHLRLGLLSLPLFALGCPDTEARYNEFIDATKDQRLTAADESGGSESETSGTTPDLPDEGLDMSGTYLLALETALGPDTPLQFVTTIEETLNPDGSGVATFTFLPLSLNVGSQTEPRECDPCMDGGLVFNDIQISAAGEFTIDMGLVAVCGGSNPVTGSDIEATLVIEGHIVHVDALCGDITGMLMSPLQADLAGSTFAMLRLADDGCDPTTLPGMGEFPYKCSQVPPAPEGGTDSDTGSTSDSSST
jgi:hypothetical protein